jgi:L-aspartate oxidase
VSARPFAPDEVRSAEVVVLGAGVAGLAAALHSAGREVLLVDATAFAAGGSSVHAQGGVAAALGADDSPSVHAEDTMSAGAGLCEREVVERVTAEGPRRVAELLRQGARFDRLADGSLALGREGAHRRRRVAHAAGDATGREMVRALAAAVRSAPHVAILEGALALDLILDRGRVAGVAAVGRDGRHLLLAASEVVLATGGIGGLWRRTTNPPESIGGGLAMAIRAGAAVADLEFMQFHPTALDVASERLPLLTEALRGEGARLVDRRGRRFMADEHPEAELAPRDVVARAIWRRLRAGDRPMLDATALGESLELRFPTVVRLCREHGFELAREPVPVTPAAHYHMGGVVVDARGRCTVPGLWACGEVARSGLHGANRLASNSLLEALVYGAAVGEALAATRRGRSHPLRTRELAARAALEVAAAPRLAAAPERERAAAAAVRALLWDGAGLERDAGGLRRAAEGLAALEAAIADRGGGELASMLLVAGLVVAAAATRTESRGAHFRSDAPLAADCWRQALVFAGRRMLPPRPVTSRAVGG